MRIFILRPKKLKFRNKKSNCSCNLQKNNIMNNIFIEL